MQTIYTSGEYLASNQTWHSEDSPWKANKILDLMQRNGIQPGSIAEIGCGAGAILTELAKKDYFNDARFVGYDISPQAIAIAEENSSDRVTYFQEDLLAGSNENAFDVLLVVDVFEHVPDYMGFIERCKGKAEYKIFHIPLDIHVSSVFRNAFIRSRYGLGHLHYFTADSAIATLKDTGHEVVEYTFTDGAFGVFKHSPSIKKAIANVPRWLFSKIDIPFTARMLGGYSLLVLTK